MLRGGVWSHVPQIGPTQGPARYLIVVLVSSDGISRSTRTWLLGVPVAVQRPQDILAVAVEGYGRPSAGNLTRLYRGWQRLGGLDRDSVDALDAGLRAALDLRGLAS